MKDIYWLNPSGGEMADVAWNAPFVRSPGVLMVGNALDDIDERGRQVSGDTLLILLNAHCEDVPFVLPTAGDGREWVRILDTIESLSPEARFPGGAQYPLQGRTLVLFTLDGNGRHRRASDSADVADDRALQVIL